jgi:hypothetical protein
MNKKIILLNIIAILMQSCTYSALATTGAGALTKMIPPVGGLGVKLPGGAGARPATYTPALSVPKINLTPAEIDRFTNTLSGYGGKQYLPQIQSLWETNPELIYNAQEAFQAGNFEAQKRSTLEMINRAKELASKSPATFSLQDAVTRNPQLESLVNTELSGSLFNIGTTMGNMAKNPTLGNEKSSVKNAFYRSQDTGRELEAAVRDIFENTTLTPQQAADKIGKLFDKYFDPMDENYNIIKAVESVETTAESTTVRQAMNQAKDLLESTKESLKSIKNILQKATPTQARSATFPEMKSFVESISTPAESPVIPESIGTSTESAAIVSTVPGEIGNPIPMPKEIKPYFEKQMNLITQEVKTTTESLTKLINDRKTLDLSPDASKDLSLLDTINSIKVIRKLLLSDKIDVLSDNPNALNIFRAKQAALSAAFKQTTDALAKLHANASKHLLHSEQKVFLATIQEIVRGIMSLEADTRTTLLVLEEVQANKEVIVQIKKTLNLAEFVGKTATDLAAVQRTARELSNILSSDAGLLKTDKAGTSLFEVVKSQIQDYLTTFEELKTITTTEDLGALQAKLKKQESELVPNLNNLFSKIAWLPTSAVKNQGLDAFRQLKSGFLAATKSIDDMFAKAATIQEKHLFVKIAKNELEMGMLTIIDKCNAIRSSIKRTIPEDKLTSEQSQSLSKLNQVLTEAINALKEIERSKTSFEVDQLTKEFFITKNREASLLPFAQKGKALIPTGPSDIISISKPSLAIPSGSALATPVGKSYTDSSLVPVSSTSVILVPKWQETLNETLKLFGLKLVLGLTAAGVVTWLVQPADKGKSSSEVLDAIDGLLAKAASKPQTEAESTRERADVLAAINKLDEVPTADLAENISTLQRIINSLDFNKFKEGTAAFFSNLLQAIKNAISNTRLKFNHHGAALLQGFNDWAERTKERWIATKPTEETKMPQDRNTQYNEAIEVLQELSKKYKKAPAIN